MWNRGAGAPTPAPSALPVKAKSASKPTVTQQASTSSREKPLIPNAKKPSFAGLQKASTSSSAGSHASNTGAARTASGSSMGLLGSQTKATRSGTVASVASARSNMSVATARDAGGPRSRSPMPSFDAPDGDGEGQCVLQNIICRGGVSRNSDISHFYHLQFRAKAGPPKFDPPRTNCELTREDQREAASSRPSRTDICLSVQCITSGNITQQRIALEDPRHTSALPAKEITVCECDVAPQSRRRRRPAFSAPRSSHLRSLV